MVFYHKLKTYPDLKNNTGNTEFLPVSPALSMSPSSPSTLLASQVYLLAMPGSAASASPESLLELQNLSLPHATSQVIHMHLKLWKALAELVADSLSGCFLKSMELLPPCPFFFMEHLPRVPFPKLEKETYFFNSQSFQSQKVSINQLTLSFYSRDGEVMTLLNHTTNGWILLQHTASWTVDPCLIGLLLPAI